MCVQVAQSCPTLCDSIDCSPPGSSVHGDSPGKKTGVECHSLLQGPSQPKDWTQISCIASEFFTIWTTREATKKTYRWLIKTWKDAQYHWLLEKCKSKLQWDITSYWPEWPSSKNPQPINSRGVEKREPSCTAAENVNWNSHYERQYGNSF